MQSTPNLNAISDDELLRRLSALLKDSRRVEADLVAHIAEVDARRLYAREAAPSMFSYCTEVLHLSEHEAFLRIAVARASREHPMLLSMLRDGRLHLSGIAKLAPHLTRGNRDRLLERAVHKSKREIEELVAELRPRPQAPAVIRRLPERRAATHPVSTLGHGPNRVDLPAPGLNPGVLGSGRATESPGQSLALDPVASRCPDPGSDETPRATSALGPDRVAAPSPLPPPVVEPVGPARFRVHFNASAELRDKLERLRALMRSSVPDGDLDRIIDVVVTEKLERLEARRFAKTKAPRRGLAETDTRPTSRHVPAAVRRIVEKRDGGRCTYRDRYGRRCTKRHALEFHHRKAFGRRGDHSPGNVALMCRVHNALLAEEDFGREKMARFRRPASQTSGGSRVRFSQSSGAARSAASSPPLSRPGNETLMPTCTSTFSAHTQLRRVDVHDDRTL